MVVLDPLEQFGGGCVLARAAHLEPWLRRAVRRSTFCAIVRPASEADEDAFWRTTLPRRDGGLLSDCSLIIDEVDRWSRPSWTRPELRRLIHYGRHQRLDLLCTCRRPANIGADLRSQADRWIAFQVTEGLDLDYLARHLDDWQRLPSLGVGEHLTTE